MRVVKDGVMIAMIGRKGLERVVEASMSPEGERLYYESKGAKGKRGRGPYEVAMYM